MRTILGREPVVFWAMAANLAMALFMLAPWNEEVHGAVNALILAVAGILTASAVSVDAVLPLLAGGIKAVFAVVLAFGVHLPDTTQVAILAIVTAGLAFFTRTQVSAKLPPVQVGAGRPFAGNPGVHGR